MVRAWYFDNDEEGNKKLPHMTDPPQFVDLEGLKKIGVLYWKVDVDGDDMEDGGLVPKLKEERGYKHGDSIAISRELMPDYVDVSKMLYTEHLHPDEEIRLAVDGVAYFDVRDLEDKWIRIEISKGDLIILPAGLYHRFTLEQEKRFVKLERFFTEITRWTPYNRPADDHPSRVAYLKSMEKPKEEEKRFSWCNFL
ncbi:1,2-dihydroxy-3-keto-5-methylthiopentene dioxygenase [Lingula anatina]|uniref:Acireductone dioxygenase n=1 Tax=Lingula anatina TaxID=7574 RepID=A0A1S3H8K2_LINAN|nr:1,2-dihydroxy-3-keto-5-methylthiopentene dioxygenase [Lingula anatina]|eukprot:XP_013381806.1 1,2-dihydroxy-3-keto-5-methylthiopentene dioxygenase [Lingula anatina]